MAEKSENGVKSPYECSFKQDYQDDWQIHENYISTFDSLEAMLLGYVWDSQSSKVDTSKITDSYASTLSIERAARVMGKLPEGETEGSAKADAGKAALMDILRQKWLYPNMNSQHPYRTKLRLWQLYSSVYGYMPMYYDWNVSNNGYVGPDCWLWNPRNLVPQQGRVSIEDMDYVTALTWVSKKYLKGMLKESNITEETIKNLEDGKPTKQSKEQMEDNDGWNLEAVQWLLMQVSKYESSVDSSKDTITNRVRNSQVSKRGIQLATRYESGDDGEWITFAPDFGYTEVRRIKNPHKNGRIPFVIKYGQPLFDNFYAMGDFQRARPLQAARDGLDNFYFKGIKMNLVPPIIANAYGVVKHTLDYREGSIMYETVPNSIRRMETSTAGLSTYQAAKSAMTGSLLTLYGSQNASMPSADALNPSQGKTPQAIDLYEQKEATRDGQEVELLEQAIEQLTDGCYSLIVNIGTEKIPVSLFSDDIEDIVDAGLDDVLELFKNGKQWIKNPQASSGELKIDPKELKGVEYRFNINPGSTVKLSKERQRQSLADFIGVIGKFQNVLQDDPNVQIEWSEIMRRYEQLSDIKGAQKFITVKDGPSQQELEMQAQMQEMAQQMQAMQQELEASHQQIEKQQKNNVAGVAYNDPDIAQAAQRLAQL